MYGEIKMKDWCCWNEEENKPYETETIGCGKERCLGCYRELN